MSENYLVFVDTSDNSDVNSIAEYERLSDDDKGTVQKFIANRIVAAKGYNLSQDTYRLKHIFQHLSGIYVNNGAFKGAMLAAGYEPLDASKTNWRFRIRKVKDPRF